MKAVSLNVTDSYAGKNEVKINEAPKFGNIFDKTPKPEFTHKVKIQNGRLETCD